MTLLTRLAFIHPIWSVALLVLQFALLLSAPWSGPEAVFDVWVIGLWANLLPLAWAYGVYRGARTAAASTGAAGPSRDWVFYITGAGLLCFPIVMLLGDALGGLRQAVEMLVGLPASLGQFAAVWLAAAALVAFEGERPRFGSNRLVGTFLLMLYWIIGVWVLRPRLRRLRQAIENREPAGPSDAALAADQTGGGL